MPIDRQIRCIGLIIDKRPFLYGYGFRINRYTLQIVISKSCSLNGFNPLSDYYIDKTVMGKSVMGNADYTVWKGTSVNLLYVNAYSLIYLMLSGIETLVNRFE